MRALSRPVTRLVSCARARSRPAAAAAMGSSSAGARDPSGNPTVSRLRELFRGGGGDAAADSWEKSWETGITPRDLGKPTPIINHLVKSGSLPKGRALVPGCGMWSTSLPNADWFTYLVADFFKWKPSEPFDLIFDYTFFCALDPSLRLAWAETVSRLLKPDGELITLIYLISDQEGGPPYNNTVADYQKVLESLGLKAVCMEDNELAIKPRKGCEKLGRWKRCGGPQSSL